MFEILCTESDFLGINSLKVMTFRELNPKKLHFLLAVSKICCIFAASFR